MAATIVDRALKHLESELREPGPEVNASAAAGCYLRLALAREEREVFAVMLLDAQHRLIAFERLFYGTIDSCTVHPREIAKAALNANASAVILAHNHPSGTTEPSRADVAITERVRQGLNLFDIRVLDHIVVTKGAHVSMSERGLM